MDSVTYLPIGTARTSYSRTEDMPIQPCGAGESDGQIELSPEFEAGLADLDGFSHVVVIYHFHRSPGVWLRLTPFLDSEERGVFATRAPCRPNPIGLSVVRLVRIEGRVLHVVGLDVLNGTPVLDIKPYVPQFDTAQTVRLGWLTPCVAQAGSCRADARFGQADPACPDAISQRRNHADL